MLKINLIFMSYITYYLINCQSIHSFAFTIVNVYITTPIMTSNADGHYNPIHSFVNSTASENGCK